MARLQALNAPKMLALLRLLRTSRSLRIDEAAQALGVSEDDVRLLARALMNVRWRHGDPGDSVLILIEDDRVTLENDQRLGGLVRLDTDTRLLLTAGLQLLSGRANESERRTISHLIGKLLGCLPEPGSVAAHMWEAGETDSLGQVRDAIASRTRLLISYVDVTGAHTRRQIDPDRLVLVDGHWNVEAWCAMRRQWRTFRLDHLRVLDEAGEQPVHEERSSPSHCFTLSVVIDAAAEHLCSDPAVIDVDRNEDGTITLQLEALSEEWAAARVCAMGTAVRSVKPQSVAEAVRERAERALAQRHE